MPIINSTITNTSSGIGITREVSSGGVYGFPAQSFTFSLPSNATDIGANALQYAFNGCTSLTSADLSSLTTVSGDNACSYTFRNCTGLTNVDISALTTVSGSNACANMFSGCTGLTSVSFPALTTTSFGSYKNQFLNMMLDTGTATTHTIHFPSNLEATIQGLDGYPRFAGSSPFVVLAFDLPATS